MLPEAIINFSKQFEYEPDIKNEARLKRVGEFIVCGMGGSHLAADLLRAQRPNISISIHKDYGLPRLLAASFKQGLFIASSYSGNTEETLDAFERAGQEGLARAVITVGGQLLELAKQSGVPYVQLPDFGLQPRFALGLTLRALMKLVGDEEGLEQTAYLAESLRPADLKERGEKLAELLADKIPVIYTSSDNEAVGYNWRIKFNETTKIPAFSNVFPELNHNEIMGFDVIDATRAFSQKFHFIFIKDEADDPRLLKRMILTQKLYEDRGLPVITEILTGGNSWEKIFNSLLLADWASYYLARHYGVDSENELIVEEFKNLMRD